MRIAFQTSTRPLWLGGMITFQDLFIALRTLPERPKLELVRWHGTPLEDYAMLSPYVDGWISAEFPSGVAPVALPSWKARVRRAARFLKPKTQPPVPAGTLRASGVDCSFSVIIDTRTDTSVPLLIWVYDLQHHHLPELISETERQQRDQAILRETDRATRLVVKSLSVAHDLETAFPQAQGKVEVVPWVADIPTAVYDTDPEVIAKQYNLPSKFFLLPNQFWTHKNHLLVAEALQWLQARNVFPIVVCTGSLFDHRNPEYLGTVLQGVSKWNLRDQFILLGMIPRSDLFALMRQSIAVLNSSRFEGFGLSAAEAKSLGKRALLSDLPSLREQDPPHATYFDPQNARHLAEEMERLWRTVPAGPDLEMEHHARAALPARQREFANAFVGLAQESIDLKS